MTMNTTARTKLEIVVEAPVLRRVEELLAEAGVRGFSVFAGLEGAGDGGGWRREGLSGAQDKRLIWTIMSADTAERVLERLAEFFQDYPGVVCVSDVRVLRGERF